MNAGNQNGLPKLKFTSSLGNPYLSNERLVHPLMNDAKMRGDEPNNLDSPSLYLDCMLGSIDDDYFFVSRLLSEFEG